MVLRLPVLYLLNEMSTTTTDQDDARGAGVSLATTSSTNTCSTWIRSVTHNMIKSKFLVTSLWVCLDVLKTVVSKLDIS